MPDNLKPVTDLIALARIYMDDGAPATAADRLRMAADKLDEIAKDRMGGVKR